MSLIFQRNSPYSNPGTSIDINDTRISFEWSSFDMYLGKMTKKLTIEKGLKIAYVLSYLPADQLPSTCRRGQLLRCLVSIQSILKAVDPVL